MRWMGPLCSPQPGTDIPSWHPQLNSEGLHVCWYVTPCSWNGSYWGRHGGRACRIQSFGFCRLLRGLLGNRGSRAYVGLRGKRLGQ